MAPLELRNSSLTWSPNDTLTSFATQAMGMILPGLVLFVLLVTLLVIAIYQLKGDNKPVQVQKTASPEELFADILCDSDADYEYKAVFRVGCPTPTFDMQQGYVDFELLGPGDYALGHPVRFVNCSVM